MNEYRYEYLKNKKNMEKQKDQIENREKYNFQHCFPDLLIDIRNNRELHPNPLCPSCTFDGLFETPGRLNPPI